MCFVPIGQRQVTHTPPTNTGSGGVNSNKSGFQALKSRFEQPNSGPTSNQTGVRPQRPNQPSPKITGTPTSTRQTLIGQRNSGVKLAPNGTPPSNVRSGNNGATTVRSGGVNTPTNTPITQPQVRNTPSPQISTPPNTGVRTPNRGANGPGRVVNVTTVLKPQPPKEPQVKPSVTPVVNRTVTEQTPAPLDKLKQNLGTIHNALKQLDNADPATIRQNLPKLEQALKNVIAFQQKSVPEGSELMGKVGSALSNKINDLKAQSTPPDPRKTTQEAMKNLTDVGVYVTGSSGQNFIVETEPLKAKAQQLASLLGQPFADKVAERFAGKTQARFAPDATHRSAEQAGMTSGGGIQPEIVSGHIGNVVVRDLSQLLIDGNGNLTNRGLGDLRIDLSHPDLIENAPIGTLMHAQSFINTLATNPAVREALQSISAPTTDATKNLVRATLGLAPDAPVGVAETRRAVLTAMLSELRQGSVGSCFATAVCVGIQKSNPEAMIRDLGEMLSTGKLKKGNTETQVVLKANSPQMTITITNEMKPGLATRPDMKAALTSMGIPQDQHATRINAAMTGMTQPTPKKILEKLAEQQGGNSVQQSGRLTTAMSAFHGATQNVLSRAFEYSVANLSANHAISQSKVQLVDGLFGNYGASERLSIPGFLERHGVTSGSIESQAAERAIKTIVGRQFSYHYDPMVASSSSDGHSDAGVFELRHTSSDGTVTDIKTPQDYQRALQSSINEALTRIVGRFPGLHDAVNGLPREIDNIATESGKAFALPSKPERRPWTIGGGGLGQDTLAAYHGVNEKSGLHHFSIGLGGGAITQPNAVRSGLQFTENLIRGMEQLQNRNQSHVPVGAPGHVFNMLPNHPTVKGLVGNLGSDASTAIRNHLNSLRTPDEPNPKIILCDTNWGSSQGSTCIALAFNSSGTPVLHKYDPATNLLEPMADNLRKFVNAEKWTATELAT